MECHTIACKTGFTPSVRQEIVQPVTWRVLSPVRDSVKNPKKVHYDHAECETVASKPRDCYDS